ncbi:MAG: methyltransferase domain-containing protein [Ktedonobacteraceae bacterium]
MAADNLSYLNERGLPLNAVDWLATHHQSKIVERRQMVQNLNLRRGSMVIDAGCGPGMWTPLLAEAIGPEGRIIGVDISIEALITARQRNRAAWYCHLVEYKQAALEQLPVAPGTADAIFSANVSQYLPQPVETFAAMGRYLADGGRLIIKDIDFGTMRFHNIDAALQARILQARECWELARVVEGFAFEDSWVGSKLAGYLRAAGYEQVQERSYRIARHYPLPADFRQYLQGIAEWFVSEKAPYLAPGDITRWLHCFLDERHNVLDQENFASEETEFVVSGVWPGSSHSNIRYFDMQLRLPAETLP